MGPTSLARGVYHCVCPGGGSLRKVIEDCPELIDNVAVTR